MIEYVNDHKYSYDRIFITGDFWRPYIYYLFYSSYNPKTYYEKGTINSIDNVFFGKADWDKAEGIDMSLIDLSLLSRGKKVLFILSRADLAKQKSLIDEGRYEYTLKILHDINGIIIPKAFVAVELINHI